MGDYLVVGINSDTSVRRLKGPTRPVNGIEHRTKALMATGLVDAVGIFDEDTPLEIIKRIRPDIIVKGGDYAPEDVVGKELAEVRIVPLLEGYSTTKLLEEK